MTRSLLLSAVLALSACAGTFGGPAKHQSAWVGLADVTEILAVGTLACDVGETVWHANQNWLNSQEENPFLGKSPTSFAVLTYNAGWMGVIGLVNYVSPTWVRLLFNGTMTVVEARIDVLNTRRTPVPACGL